MLGESCLSLASAAWTSLGDVTPASSATLSDPGASTFETSLPLPFPSSDKVLTAALISLGHISLLTSGGAYSSSLRTIDTTCSCGSRCSHERFESRSSDVVLLVGSGADVLEEDDVELGDGTDNCKLEFSEAAAAVNVGNNAAIYMIF